jgi:hypothetical protein
MSGTLANIAAMTVTGTPGTGTITLNAAVSGYIPFADAGVIDGDIVSYMARDGSNREIGTALYTASGTTLSSRTVLNSTNSNNAVSLTSAAKIYLTAAAQYLFSGALYPRLKRPRDADFAWVNQGGASVAVNANGGIYLLAPASASVQARLRKESAPGTPYTLTAALMFQLHNVDFQIAGIAFRENATGKLTSWGVLYEAGGALISREVRHWSSATSHNVPSSSIKNLSAGSGLQHLRMRFDGTDLFYDWSVDGERWIQQYTEAKAAFFTTAPDEIGFLVNDQGGSLAAAETLLSWAKT